MTRKNKILWMLTGVACGVLIVTSIWYPYLLTYFSYTENKRVKRIIKGKVICYSSKI